MWCSHLWCSCVTCNAVTSQELCEMWCSHLWCRCVTCDAVTTCDSHVTRVVWHVMQSRHSSIQGSATCVTQLVTASQFVWHNSTLLTCDAVTSLIYTGRRRCIEGLKLDGPSAKEPLIKRLFCRKWRVTIRHPMGFRHPVPVTLPVCRKTSASHHVWSMDMTWFFHIWDMTHPCTWHDIWDMTHPCTWHDSSMYMAWLIHAHGMTYETWLIHVHGMTYETWLIHVHGMTYETWLIHVHGMTYETWLIHVHGMTYETWLIHVHGMTYETWLIHVHGMTHPFIWQESCKRNDDVTSSIHVWHDSFICVSRHSWLIHMCDMTH